MSVIANILAAKNIEIAAAYQGVKKNGNWEHHNWKVFISGGNGLAIDTEYNKGMLHSHHDGVSADDLIPCLIADTGFASYDFADFCHETGYEQYDIETGRENKEARRVWNGCKKSKSIINAMQFSDEEMQAIIDYIEEQGL